MLSLPLPRPATDRLYWFGTDATGTPLLRFVAFHRMRRHTPIRPHQLNCHELAIVESGELELRVGGRRCSVHAGEMALVPPHVTLASEGAPNTGNVYWVGVALRDEYLAEVPDRLRPAMVALRRRLVEQQNRTRPAPAGLLGAARACFELASGHRAGVSLHKMAAAYALLAHLADALTDTGRRPAAITTEISPERSLIAPALRMLESGPPGGLPVGVLAAACHMSRSTFNTLFKQVTGVPPHTWINRRRIRQAAGKLRSGRTPVSHIAADLGFSSAQHFASVFRTFMGASPTDFRKRGHAARAADPVRAAGRARAELSDG